MGGRTATRYTNALAQKDNLDGWRLSRRACTLSLTLSRNLTGEGIIKCLALVNARLRQAVAQVGGQRRHNRDGPVLASGRAC